MRIEWPKLPLNSVAPTNPDSPVKVPDAMAVLAALNESALAAMIDAGLNEAYSEWGGLTLTATERQTRLAEIDAKIAAAELSVAAAAWAMIEREDLSAIRYLAAVSPAAVLGVR